MKITVKNYRCFSEETPLCLELAEGITAFVGPNNSGKTACVRFFYELRDVLKRVSSAPELASFTSGSAFAVSYHGLGDASEIFCNANSHDLVIAIEFTAVEGVESATIELRCSRTESNVWRAALLYEGSRLKSAGIVPVAGHVGLSMETGRAVALPDADLALLYALAYRSLYVGAFRNAISEGSGSYYDVPIGTTFIQQWNDWKTGNGRDANAAVIKLTDELARLFGFNRLEINSALAHTSLQCVVDGRPYQLREIGAGFSQFLVVLANVVMRRPEILLIDEPELNLHPRLQTEFLVMLASYCAKGVIFSTHSVGLARAVAERIYGCRIEDRRHHVREFEAISSLSLFAGEMGFSGYHDIGGEALLLVEGATDVKAMQQILRHYRIDHRTIVLPLGGSNLIHQNAAHELGELTRLCVRVVAVIDSERAAENDALSPERVGFVDTCKELGIRVHVLNRRATENYCSLRALNVVFGNGAVALGEYQQMTRGLSGWNKKTSWRVFRAMTVDELSATDLGQFLATIFDGPL